MFSVKAASRRDRKAKKVSAVHRKHALLKFTNWAELRCSSKAKPEKQISMSSQQG